MDPMQHQYLTSAEVAELFGVHKKTVVRWGNEGILRFVSTPGGHRRFFREDLAYALEPENSPGEGRHPKR